MEFPQSQLSHKSLVQSPLYRPVSIPKANVGWYGDVRFYTMIEVLILAGPQSISSQEHMNNDSLSGFDVLIEYNSIFKY